MPSYKYRAKKSADDIVESRIEAKNKEDAVDKISALGYFPISVTEDASLPKVKFGSPLAIPLKIRSSEITLFSRQLATLIRSGVNILHAINIISEQSTSPSFKKLMTNIYNEVKNGKSLSSVLSASPGLFSSLYIALIRAGEESGTLPAILWKIADHRRKQEEIFSRVRTALAYPILMGVVGIGTVIFMLTFVMPRLMGIFSSMGESLPLPTRMLIAASTHLRQGWPWIILIGAALFFVLKKQAKNKVVRNLVSALQLKVPIWGDLMLKTDIARFSRTLELLIKTGIPILRAIEVSLPVLGNELVKKQLLVSHKELEQGGSFGKSLKNSKVFPVFMSNLIIVGEETGKLNDALGEVADAYEHDVDDAIKVMTSLLEPLMILAMGLIVGFIVVAMLLPLFQINMMAK